MNAYMHFVTEQKLNYEINKKLKIINKWIKRNEWVSNE